MVDIVTLYDSLLDASFRGIAFGIPDIRHQVGRRVQRFLFPGQDAAAFQDLGADDGVISLTGIIVGDDYVARMQALAQAFRTAGPGTLVHPWLGELQVVARPATFRFDQKKYRVVAFEAELWLATPDQAATPDTLGQIMLAVGQVQSEARALLAQVLAPAALTLRAVGAAEGFVSGLAATFLPLAALQLPGPLAALAGLSVVGLAPDAGYAAALADVVAGPGDAAALAAAPPLPSAIGPGDAAVAPVAADPAAVAAALIASVPAVAGAAPLPALSAATGALVLASAVQVASDIVFVSQQDAADWRDTQDAALAAAADAVAALAGGQPTAAGTLWQALNDLRAALSADMASAIGRLPSVVSLTLPGPAPLWLVAHHLSGDQPAAMLARFTDLAARNDIGQPGMVAGTLEALGA